MDICERVGVGVPPPETEVEPTDAGEVVVDYNDLRKVRLVGEDAVEKGGK